MAKISMDQKFQSILEYIRDISQEDCWSDEDDFCPMEFSGGNFSDCYEGGKEAGTVLFARELLKKLEDAGWKP